MMISVPRTEVPVPAGFRSIRKPMKNLMYASIFTMRFLPQRKRALHLLLSSRRCHAPFPCLVILVGPEAVRLAARRHQHALLVHAFLAIQSRSPLRDWMAWLTDFHVADNHPGLRRDLIGAVEGYLAHDDRAVIVEQARITGVEDDHIRLGTDTGLLGSVVQELSGQVTHPL
jgi:hypothetical protein